MTISSWSSEENINKGDFDLLISESKLDAKANIELSEIDEIADRYDVNEMNYDTDSINLFKYNLLK